MTNENNYFGTPESRDRDARLVGHKVKPARVEPETITESCRKIIAHVNDGRVLWDSELGGIIDTLRALLAERDRLEAENEGALAIIATERAEVLKLRAEVERLHRENNALWVASGTTAPIMINTVAGMPMDQVLKLIFAALAEREKIDD